MGVFQWACLIGCVPELYLHMYHPTYYNNLFVCTERAHVILKYVFCFPGIHYSSDVVGESQFNTTCANMFLCMCITYVHTYVCMCLPEVTE